MVCGEGGRIQRRCVLAGYVGASVTGMFAIQKEERSLRGSGGVAECLDDVIPQGVQICQGARSAANCVTIFRGSLEAVGKFFVCEGCGVMTALYALVFLSCQVKG